MDGPRLNPSLRGFQCLRCEKEYPVCDLLEGCPACTRQGHASSVVATYDADLVDPVERFALLGAPSLGEGATPLLPLHDVAEALDMECVWLKAEGQNPTGSHKDRFSAQLVARASMLGSPRVLAASSGNAGVSLAAYAARAGLACTILTRAGIDGTWGRDIVELGAELVVVATGEERWVRVAEMTRAGQGYPATNYLIPVVGSNPFGVQGYKAIGHELAADLAETPPDAVLVPTARGDLLWGIWEGLREAWAAKEIARLPILVAVEPFVRAAKILAGADYRGSFPGTSNQIAIASSTVAWQTIHTLRASGGVAIDVDDTEAAAAQVELVRMGIPLERCSAAPLVALRKLRASGVLAVGSRAVLVATSDGRREDPLADPCPPSEGPKPGPPSEGPKPCPPSEGPQPCPPSGGPQPCPPSEGPQPCPPSEGPKPCPPLEGPDPGATT